ncbi:HIT domain-containing protein [Paraglaciecola aestuariivivens]
MSEFVLHPQLAKDSELICDLALCQVRLINDSHYPWLILVPRQANISEIIELDSSQQRLLWQESALVSRALTQLFTPDKLNIAALGNMVAQLHIHHIVRYESDISWPNPIWGRVAAKAYTEQELSKRLSLLAEAIRSQE